jgi:hypothetical protein
MKHLTLLFSSLLLLVVLATGCGSPVTLGETELGLLGQIQSASSSVRHAGTRRVESYYLLDGTGAPLVYREGYQADGQGHFAITPLGAVQGGPQDPSEFIAIQMIRAGFNQRYRDFRVRDLAAFLVNYKLTSASQIVQVAGRDCLELHIARKDGSTRYEVALDVVTGLVLRYREFDGTGQLFSLMEYETYDANPDQTGVVFHQQVNQEQPLVTAVDLGFSPLVPKLLPDSAFTFLEATKVVEPSSGATFAKLSFTDGVETVFFIDGGPDLKGHAKAGPQTSPPQTAGPHVAGVLPTSGNGQMDEVRAWHEGPLTVMWGRVAGHQLYLIGKATQADLMGMLLSALP